jgi:catechol 2,3-dioxygenase-like lactoylglutathione lyase family enzyme
MITSVKFVTINVTDQERAKAFYTDVLGFELLTDMPMGGPDDPDGSRWIEVAPKGAETRLVLFPADAPSPGMAPPVFTADDMQATHAEFAAKGVEFTVPPKLEAWGSWWAQFKDSEGNEFGLGQEVEQS